MFQTKTQRFKVAILILLFGVMQGCMAPNAIQTKLGVVESKLEKLTEQHSNTQFLADKIEKIENETHQTTQIAEELFAWKKNVQAENVTYAGAGWVVAGTSVIVLIFVGTGALLVRAFIKRGNLLNLLTCAVQKVGKNQPNVQQAIKNQLNKEIDPMNGGKFCEQDKKALGRFCRKMGTFFKNA